MRKNLIVLPLVFTVLSPVSAFAGEEGDNSIVQQMQYKDYNYLHNVADGSLNPVSISDIPVSQLSLISAGYAWRQGGYHNVDASGHTDGFSVDAYGIKRMERLSFEGGIAYFNYDERARCWNSTLFQSRLNPFILADFDPSDYNTERFRVDGRMAYKVSSRFRFGINADYNVGVMSDEKDPRVETKGMRFVINPGVQWDATSRLSIGATGGLNLFNETSRYTCVATAVNFKFYLMSGLGTFFPQTGNAYTRDAKGTSWFAAVDLKYRFSDRWSDYLYLSYADESENATDGGSTYQFKGGDYMNNVLTLRNRLSYVSGRYAHNVELEAQTNDVKGRWYDQRAVTENGTTRYEIMNSSIKHKETFTSIRAAYRFDMLDGEGVSSLTAGVSAGWLTSDTKNFPEMYFRKYTRIDVRADVMKHFSLGRVRLGVGLDGGYAMSPSSSCDFSGLELEHTYSMPMYAYLTSGAWSVNGRVEAWIPVGKFVLGAHAGGGTTRCIDGKSGLDGTAMNSVNCGLSMAF